MEDFWVPLGHVSDCISVKCWSAYLVHDILQRVRAVDGKANKDDVGLGVGERPQSVVFLLSSGIPEGKLDHLACGWMRSVCDIVLKHSRYIFLYELV
jgi:hypothetical protein